MASAIVVVRLALVNKGNVMFNKGDFEKAREFYNEALQNDSSCVEALYNFGEPLQMSEFFIYRIFYLRV